MQHGPRRNWSGPMSQLGHFQTSGHVRAKSVHPQIADMRPLHRHVGFVPILLQKSVERGHEA